MDSDRLKSRNIKEDDCIHWVHFRAAGEDRKGTKRSLEDLFSFHQALKAVPTIFPESVATDLRSFKCLNSVYTRRSIASMGSNGKGILFVHSFKPDAGLFGTDLEQFVQQCPYKILRKKIVIDGSVVAFNGEPKMTLAETSSACGYIISFDKENLFRSDSRVFDSIDYSLDDQDPELSLLNIGVYSLPEHQCVPNSKIYSIDDLIHLPFILLAMLAP